MSLTGAEIFNNVPCDEADCLGVGAVLLTKNAGAQRGSVVILMHSNRRLQQHRPGVHLPGHEVNGAAGPATRSHAAG